MNILIDADGCPVVDLTLQIAKQFSVPVIILCDACASLLLANGVPMKQVQEWLGDVPAKKNGQTNKIHLSIRFGGASGSRTLAPVSRPIAFRVRPLTTT